MAKPTGTGASGRSGGRVTKLLRTLLVLAVLAVAGLFGVRWALDRTGSTEAETTEVQTEIADLEVELERYLSLEELRLQLEAQLLAAQATLPPSPDLPGILDQIVGLAQSTGARLLSVLPSPPVPVSSPGADPSLLREVPLDIRLAGTQDAVVGFVGGLRRLERVIVVDSVSTTWPGNELRAGHLADLEARESGAAEADAVEASQDQSPSPDAAPPVSDPEFEVIADLEARAFVWSPGAASDRAAAEAVAGLVGGENATEEEVVDGGG